MNLTLEQSRRLSETLSRAFINYTGFSMFLSQRMNIRLEEIASEDGMKVVTYKAIQWFESEGRIKDLVNEARNEKPDNQDLRDLIRDHPELHDAPGLAQSHSHYLISPAQNTGKGIKFDYHHVLNYNLEEEVAKFLTNLGYEGVFSFTIAVDRGRHLDIAKDYVVARLLLELERRDREYNDKTVYLQATDLTRGGMRQVEGSDSNDRMIIEDKLLREVGYSSMSELIMKEPNNTFVFIIINKNIPSRSLRILAEPFWEKMLVQVSPLLQASARSLIFIWVNGSIASIKDQKFHRISCPKEFKVAYLVNYFRGKLRQYELDERTIKSYTDRLEKYSGDLRLTYAEMKQIVEEIRGRIYSYE